MKMWLSAFVLLVTLAACGGNDSGPVEVPDEQVTAIADPMLGSWFGDLDEMVERRQIRVLVPYSRTFYFVDGRGNPAWPDACLYGSLWRSGEPAVRTTAAPDTDCLRAGYPRPVDSLAAGRSR